MQPKYSDCIQQKQRKGVFDNLRKCYERNPDFANGTRVFNLDETGTKTVPDSQPRIIAQKGKKSVCQVTSGERVVLVTTCCIVSASGVALPPVLIFPRVHFKENMLHGAPSGSLGSASKSENPALLIYDNHESHLSVEAVDLAKRSGVTILTIPPHCSARLHPLDVLVDPSDHYDVASCVGIAHSRGMTPENIMSVFKKSGIFPYDPDVFSHVDFLPSEVTNRLLPALPTDLVKDIQEQENRVPKTPEKRKMSDHAVVTPEEIRPFPKEQERRPAASKRRRISSSAPNSSPVHHSFQFILQ
ncbi:hypothetical protein ANN_03960 [Periplaneta americana]|uniref:DDE-1 domain-containing protein n=1 Tax=Periplaneta americana TaxID=6978 RepID=A0ABQ8T793_PERAM|nr:hypothetical protein ANN_03960 [Periplaneta americana]